MYAGLNTEDRGMKMLGLYPLRAHSLEIKLTGKQTINDRYQGLRYVEGGSKGRSGHVCLGGWRRKTGANGQARQVHWWGRG